MLQIINDVIDAFLEEFNPLKTVLDSIFYFVYFLFEHFMMNLK